MSTQASRSTAKVVIERTYAARIEDVWALWTTKAGFESWWGPQGFRAEVHELDARVGGALRYDMIAATPEMVAAMKAMGQPASHPVRSAFSTIERHKRLVLTNVIDFLPGVAVYEANIDVALTNTIDSKVRMVVTLDAMHDDQFTQMQKEGMTSQITKLDERFA